MDVAFINPFVESVYDFFSTMLDSEVQRKSLSLREGYRAAPNDVVASIDLDGWIRGTVEISFPRGTAIAVFNRLTGMDSREVDDSVLDSVGESVNIIAGSAKAKLGQADAPPLDLGIPRVFCGHQDGIDSQTMRWIEISFASGLGPLALRVAFQADS
ncbi:MAG TPA: chemotaxis protein CheX [bacterium]|nr:chemotaxis protein CheX [bacterium]HPO09268.1 chemotaxis protein CheX [bacterium]HQO35340.1 chemotaxis protein CheX [bacterium]HQP99755.1 chemotaxis protein CheX [bacterium]